MSDDIEHTKGQLKPYELLHQMDLDLSRLCIKPAAAFCLEYAFDIQPSEFIKYAEFDIQQDSTHGLVNALSNAKRAIDCQVDTVLGCFGLLSRRNFPQKMKILNSMGMVTPRIVNKVVKARNYLEHEFKKPERGQVEDAVGIATLFCVSLDKALRNFHFHFYIGTVVDGVYDEGDPFQDKWLDVAFDSQEILYEVSGLIFDEVPTLESRKARHIKPAIIKPQEQGYIELVKLAFSLNKPITESEIVQQAIQFVQLFTTATPKSAQNS